MTVTAPRTPLSHERVIAAAIRIADDNAGDKGAHAVTMRRLADALGVHPTSIYNHVATKDAILDGIADALIAEARLPATVGSWQAWVRAFAAGLRDVARAHPGAFLVLTQRAASGEVAREVAEVALDALRRGGLSSLQAGQAFIGINLALLGVALNECPPTAPLADSGPSQVSSERYPRLHETSLAVAGLGDGVWDLVVDWLIAGVGQYAPTRAGTGHPDPDTGEDQGSTRAIPDVPGDRTAHAGQVSNSLRTEGNRKR